MRAQERNVKMAEKRESKGENKTSFNIGDTTITIPEINSKKDNDEYINKVLEGVVLSPEDNSDKNGLNETQNKNTEINNIDAEIKNDNSKGLRKLAKFEKILMAIIIIVPLIQILLYVKVPANKYFIYCGISLLLVGTLSALMKQYSMLFVTGAFTILSVLIAVSGISHGLMKEDLSKRTMFRISYLNSYTPKKCEYSKLDDETISELKGKFIYYYKYGCADCLGVQRKLDSFLESKGYDVVCVETRSDFGKELREKYPIEEVPAGLVIEDDNSGFRRVIYKADENGASILDTKALLEVFNKLDKIKGD